MNCTDRGVIMFKYYVSAITDKGFVGYVYTLDYELNTKDNIERLCNDLSKQKGNAVIIFLNN